MAEQTDRLITIRNAVLAFCRSVAADRVAVLDYAYGAQGAHYAGELGGVIRVALAEAGLRLDVVNESSARTLLGTHPRKSGIKIKDWAVMRLVDAGAPSNWPIDCLDAFVAANSILATDYGSALVLTEGT